MNEEKLAADELRGRRITLALLSALVQGAKRPVAAARDQEPTLPALSLDHLDARIHFLSSRLGLPEIKPVRLAKIWAEALARGASPSRRTLIELARRAVAPWEEVDPQIGPWRREILARLEPALSSMGALEVFTPDTPTEIRESHLELHPLLSEWPQRLLNHIEWAYAETPLPELRPLPLDKVWVDLHFVPPFEAEVPTTGEALRDALDLRYEQRHWFADPLEFTLEGLAGSAVLVGPPGSGKTTLLKWIARRLIANPEGKFLLPLFVPLRTYSKWKRDNPGTHILDFGLAQAGIKDARQRDLWTNTLSYLSGPRGENVLLLLDGWDEVREGDREELRRDIDDYSHSFSILLTSRPSGRPKNLLIPTLYEIMELGPASIEVLIGRWFEHAGEPHLAEALRDQLDSSLDLRRLARNPFLLTLLCGLKLRAERYGKGSLPSSRTALYKEATELIYRQDEERHKGDVRQKEPRWASARRRQVERLALWLLDDAPEAPRYVFGPEDVALSGADSDLLERYLKPSRLLAQWGLTPDSHHFLHTTFQEYLAACALSTATPGQLLRRIRRYFFSSGWQEVFYFLAGLADRPRDLFWQEMAKVARAPDRFGHIFLRLARFAAEAGLDDGGLSRLGVDIRGGLWAGIVRFSSNALFVDAYAILDPAGLSQRVRSSLAGADRRTEALLLQAVGRTAAPEISKVLVDQILGGDRQTAMVALNQLDICQRLDAEGRARLRAAAASRKIRPEVRGRAIWALGGLRDHGAIDLFVDAIRDDTFYANDVFHALSALGSEEAVDVIGLLLPASDDSEWVLTALASLENIRNAASRNLLLEFIALRSPEDPAVVEALQALGGMPIHRGGDMLIGFLSAQEPEVRAAAASALAAASGFGFGEALTRAAREDQEEAVRASALRSLEHRALPADAHWLKKVIRDQERSGRERTLALTALVNAAQRFKGSTDAVWLLPLAAGEILEVLELPQDPELTQKAAALAFLIGDVTVAPLLALCRNEELDIGIRRRACETLGRLRAREAVGTLIEWLRRSPDVIEDEETLPDKNDNLACYAARALAAIDPALLLREPGLTAGNALARWAIENGALVFDDHIIGPNGQAMAWAAPPGNDREIEAPRPPSEIHLHADAKLFIGASKGDSSQLTFELAVRDPRKGPERDDFGSITLPRSPGEFVADLLLDLEGLSCEEHASREITLQRLAAKGTTLLRLLPVGLQTWLWILKDRVRSLELYSEDPFLPWELTRLQTHHGGIDSGRFLCETFAITRWLPAVAVQLDFPLSRIALVAPQCVDLPSTATEREDILALRMPGLREVVEIEPSYLPVTAALRSGEFDAWHFIGHGLSTPEDPDRWSFPLEDSQPLRPEDLKNPGNFGRRRPWVFLNGCRTGSGGFSIDGTSGWAERFLEAGAGAFIGTHWSVGDQRAREFARGLYTRLLQGEPVGEALNGVRKDIFLEDPLTALAYVAYAHPLAAHPKGSHPIGPEPGLSSKGTIGTRYHLLPNDLEE